MSVRARLTLLHAGLLVACTALLLGVSWWLLGRHVDRTLPAAYADAVIARVGLQYALALVGVTLLALGLGWLAATRALAPLNAMVKRLEVAAEARRRFVADAGHELRTPLTVIRTEAEVALDDPHATEAELREMGRAVLETSERMEGLLDGLLALAAGERGLRETASVDLAAVARRAAAGAGVDARISAASVSGHEPLLGRAIENLLENALRHNRPGGTAQMTVGADDRFATVRVVNDGPRIERESLARLTEPFVRLDRRGSGQGLGLAIVRAVTEAHGGELRLRARDTGGLEAELRLPALTEG